MARGRFLSDSVAKDIKLNSLSVEAELVYLMTIPHLDRDGLIEGDTEVIYGTVCPKRRIFIDRIEEFIQEWILAGLVIAYDCSAGRVLWFKGFAKNQLGLRYDRETPSKFPPHPDMSEPSDELPQTPIDDVGNVRQNDGGVRQESGNVRQTSAQLQEQLEVKDQVKDQIQQLDEEEDARDPVAHAWFETYGEDMPPKIEKAMLPLVVECGQSAVIHGIRESVHAESRSFKFIASCARNYIPPPPIATNGHSSAYHVELPGVYQLQPPENPPPVAIPPSLPPPMPTGDPWAVALAEMMPTLLGPAQSWLTGSRMELVGDLAGDPLYRIVVEPRAAAGVEWLTTQTRDTIRRKLSSILRQRIAVEIVAAEMEIATP